MSGQGSGSSYYIGPFGRMLPTAGGPSSERQPEHPANLSESGDPPYQLPPPRVPASLQFGTDPSLRQTDSPGGKDNGPKQEQLPSLSQILTTEGPSSSSHPQVYAPLTPSTERRKSAYNLSHDPRLSLQHSQPALHDRSKGHSESLSQPYNTGLPPLSQVALHAHRNLSHHTPTRSDPSSATFSHGQLPFHSTPLHDQVLGGELSSPESASKPQKTPVRPAVVDERIIEGEGLCFIYADGSYCPQTIDGTPVNANWGVTKAGRPRKRLALACLTCREKKIKCNPATEAMCDQCRKSGRECRFESA
jgi:hypothetical protein